MTGDQIPDPRLGALPREPERDHVTPIAQPPWRWPLGTEPGTADGFERAAAQEWLGELLRGAALDHQEQGTRVGGKLLPLRSVAAYLEETESDGLEFWVQIGEHTFSVAIEHL